jgi:uncharacterized membrane protein
MVRLGWYWMLLLLLLLLTRQASRQQEERHTRLLQDLALAVVVLFIVWAIVSRQCRRLHQVWGHMERKEGSRRLLSV